MARRHAREAYERTPARCGSAAARIRKLKGDGMASLTRRHFFHAAGMALTAAQAALVIGANDRIHVGVVGLGGRGRDHLNAYTSIAECAVTALCDVDQASLERAQT